MENYFSGISQKAKIFFFNFVQTEPNFFLSLILLKYFLFFFLPNSSLQEKIENFKPINENKG